MLAPARTAPLVALAAVGRTADATGVGHVADTSTDWSAVAPGIGALVLVVAAVAVVSATSLWALRRRDRGDESTRSGPSSIFNPWRN